MLKEVVFKGFKSFADQQTITLNAGINGIIGPNGCGKSNLIDGISFVLGAQSAKNLRGGKMTDLIFAGTAKAKGKDSAEVTLVMDNSSGLFKKKDADTISVTRKLHKNGTSEYFIDGVPSRLRDVQDLFMDTGVGSDSYSIIGQNQVNKILSTKLDERRSIFEEASGIVKLRQQKEKTEKNLKDADVNIIRIDDIVVEIERQLKPLERQAKKAEEFKVFDDELASLEMQYLLHEYHELNDVVSKNKERAESLSALIEEKNSFLQSTEDTITTLKDEYQMKNNKLFDAQGILTSVKEKIEKQKGAISLIEEKISNSQKNIIDYDKRLNEVESEHTVSAEDFKNKQRRIQEISKELLSLDEEMISIEQTLIDLEVQKTTSSIDLDSRKQKLVDLMNKLNKKTVEQEQVISNIQETKEKQNHILTKNESFNSDKEKLEQIFIDSKLVYDELKNRIEAFDKQIFKDSNQLNSLSEQKNVLSDKISTINSSIYQTTNKINSINSFIENNEGFYDGVKAILNEKKLGRFSGVVGAVAELLRVENDYEAAYETLLQGSMQHLVTMDDSVAKEAVAYLKNNHKGRATFLPLTMAKPYTFDNNELATIKKTKGIHSALDFVSYDNLVQPIIHSLLGRSIIADDLDIAVDFMKKSGIRCRISTVDGDLVQSNSISGGGNKNKKSSILSKQNELESLVKELELLQQNQISLTNEIESVKIEIENLISSSKENNTQLNEVRLSFATTQSEYETAKLNLDIFNEKTKDIQLEERELTIKLSSYEKHLALLKIEIEDTEKDIQSINSSMSNTEDSSSELFSMFEQKREEKTELLLKINSLKEESKQLNTFMDEIGNDSSTLEEKLGKLYRSKQDELTNIDKFNDDKEFEQKELLKFERESLGLTSDVDTLKQECDEINLKISNLENDIKFDRDEKEQYMKELNKINILLSKKETELKNNLLRLKEGYNITEENIDAFELLEIDYEKSRKRIGELKKYIANLGNVNVEAIEEYRALKERYLDEKGQLDDIKNAKKDLKMLLEKVEEDMTNRFTTTFNEIATIFTTTYKELFEGGTAKLFLENPDKPLESAIEIIAQPPGKKPESLSLLSGGEKAFTAVALIFAIISAKPSPFVILDEVDAPLDEINVFRFAKQLARYKDKSQFIVITHRKGTMMATDSITGITQKEKGISIVFPYSIEERSKLIDKAAN